MKKVLAILVILGLSACSSSDVKPYNPYKERKFFGVAVRKLPPEPVYNRLTTAYLPEPLPPRNVKRASYSKLAPVYQFEIKDATIEETARVIAGLARYTSYCSSVIANRKVNLVAVGTIDEIADLLAEKTGSKVTVDHANHEVRVLANGGGRVIKDSSAEKETESNRKVINEYPADTKHIDGLPGDVKVSDKTNGFLNNIKIEG